MRNWGSMGTGRRGMLRAVYLSSVLLFTVTGASSPAVAESFSPPHPIAPVGLAKEEGPSYATPPTYGATSQYARASPAGPAVVDRVPLSSRATPLRYSQPLPPPP